MAARPAAAEAKAPQMQNQQLQQSRMERSTKFGKIFSAFSLFLSAVKTILDTSADIEPVSTIPNVAAVQVITVSEDHTFELNEDALSEVLMREEVKDRFVCVVSVAGAFRKGKSFLLSFFLRYLYSTYVRKDSTDWLGNKNEPLTGFSWCGSSKRNTTGILMWPEIFLHDFPNGDKVAIILLDTQGTFDSESTVRDCTTIFALSTLLASVQIYNISQNIQEDDLQHLQLFTEYGRLALDDSEEKPFQHLQFLVRDWGFPYEAEYGMVGGNKILQNRLEVSEKQHPELQSLRCHIASCFEMFSCFLMPHPGLNVVTNPNFDGRLKDITPEFNTSLRSLVPGLLSPDNLICKKINGQKVRARELVQCFQSYISIFTGNELPEPKSMFMATAELNFLLTVTAAKELYKQLMADNFRAKNEYLSEEKLNEVHLDAKGKALEQFDSKRKMGGKEFIERYRNQLDADLENSFDSYKVYNESLFNLKDTPLPNNIMLSFLDILHYISNMDTNTAADRLVKAGANLCVAGVEVVAAVGTVIFEAADATFDAVGAAASAAASATVDAVSAVGNFIRNLF